MLSPTLLSHVSLSCSHVVDEEHDETSSSAFGVEIHSQVIKLVENCKSWRILMKKWMDIMELIT